MNFFDQHGFEIIEDVFSEAELQLIIASIQSADTTAENFRKSDDLFAVRQFLQSIPAVFDLVFTQGLRQILMNRFGDAYFVCKSIYFDKPATSNWFVAYHQDLTISVDRKIVNERFGPWTVKQDQFAVQPPLEILEDNFTVRIHLDKTNEQNGALRVIPGTHLKGIIRRDCAMTTASEVTCCVDKGGMMLMRPLLMHASGRTTNGARRRVIHLEFSRNELPQPLNWSERMSIPSMNFPANQ